jgi:hypothetical protein
MFKGTTSITDGIKGLFKGLADAILGELARVAASSTMRLLFGGGTTVGALANFFGPGGSLAAGGDNGGGGGGGGGAGLISNASSVANLPSTWDKITSFFGGGSGATASEGAAAFSGATAGGEVGVAAGGATAGIGAGGAVGGTIGGGAAAFEGAVATGELSAAASGAGAAAGGVSAAGAASGIGAALVIAFGAWDIMTEKSLPYTIGYSIPSGKIGPNGIVGNMIARKTDKATGATQDFIQDPNPFSGQVGLWWQKFGLGDTPISVGTGFSLTPGMDYYSAILGASPQKDWPQDLQGLTPVNDDGFQLADYTGHYQHFSEQYPQIAAWYADKYGGMFPGVPAKFATGGSGIVTKPTMISLGENGPERFSVSPMASGDKGRGGLTINLSNVVMDEYGWNTFMRRVKRELGLDI